MFFFSCVFGCLNTNMLSIHPSIVRLFIVGVQSSTHLLFFFELPARSFEIWVLDIFPPRVNAKCSQSFSVSLAIQIMLRTVSCFWWKALRWANRFSLHLLTNSHSWSVYDLRQYCFPRHCTFPPLFSLNYLWHIQAFNPKTAQEQILFNWLWVYKRIEPLWWDSLT